MTNALLQPEPAERAGVGWAVFERLAERETADSTVLERMTQEQRLVFAFYFMRQEVNSGGFDSYFCYTGGNTAGFAAEAARMVGPGWGDLVEDACGLLGSPYPTDSAARELIINRLAEKQPDLFDALNERFYALEEQESVDGPIDAFIWSHKSSFFR